MTRIAAHLRERGSVVVQCARSAVGQYSLDEPRTLDTVSVEAGCGLSLEPPRVTSCRRDEVDIDGSTRSTGKVTVPTTRSQRPTPQDAPRHERSHDD